MCLGAGVWAEGCVEGHDLGCDLADGACRDGWCAGGDGLHLGSVDGAVRTTLSDGG